ncbi:MAG: DPP IV N-terminal domain-containing protein, partial [Bacteroidales bacterium]|nr:DPP IV N-terminal domain-containing protein [Bacteroidales bacterium]
MKQIIQIAVFFVLTAVSATAQQFTLDDIYKNYTYYHYPFFDACQIYGNTIYCGEYTIPFESEEWRFPVSQLKAIPNVPQNSDILANSQGTRILYSEDKKSFRRNSSIGSYMYCEKGDSVQPKPLFDGENIQILNPVFSPDGEKLCFVYNNDLCFTTFDGTYTRITEDGEDGYRNGSPNLVYEEEFDMTAAYWWSPDSKKICFLSFDESSIKNQPIQRYDSIPTGAEGWFEKEVFEGDTITSYQPEKASAYSSIEKYSFAGQANCTPNCWVYFLETDNLESLDKEIVSVASFSEGGNDEYYIPAVTWLNDNELAISKINRAQDHENIIGVPLIGKKLGKAYFIQETTDSFVNASKLFSIPDSSNNLIALWEYDGRRMLVMFRPNFDNGCPKSDSVLIYCDDAPEATVYFDDFVTECYGYFPSDSTVRYQKFGKTPRDRQVLAKNIYTEQVFKLSEDTGWNEAKFSEDGSFMLLHHSKINVARNSEYTISVELGIKHHEDEEIAGFEKLIPQWIKYEKHSLGYVYYDDMELAPIEWITIPTEKDSLNAYILKPQSKKKKKYPVYVTTYGGPTGQSVVDAYNYETFWYQYLVQQGYVVVVVDTRSSDGLGLYKEIYGKLGEAESYDMHAVAEYLKKQPFVDGSRMAIEGWSFGGYLSLLTAAKYPDDYKAVVSIAPVADWRLYDNIYSERYMGNPIHNSEGYDNSSVLKYLPNIEASIFLAYGTADDN